MIVHKLLILIFLSLTLYSSQINFDVIELAKIKKLINKEEQIASAYKKYLIIEGTIPTLTNLIDEDYLPKGFSKSNLFGSGSDNELELITTSTTFKIKNNLSSRLKLKSTSLDVYYSNENRTFSKAALSSTDNTKIKLTKHEKFIQKLVDESKISKSIVNSKYLLDKDGVIHWYDSDGKLLYSYNQNNLIAYPDANMVDSSNNINDAFVNLLVSHGVLFAGQTIFNIKDKADEYINIGGETGIIKVGTTTRDIGKTIIQFSRRAGGMIVNGDIYTWGNNGNKIVGFDKSTYTQANGTAGSKSPVITGLVRARAKTYIDNIDNKNYFSSPLRPKFIDFFSAVYYSTCGVTVEGALYCGGVTGDSYQFGNTFTHVVADNSNRLVNSTDPEMLYRSRFFDGIHNKAKKIFANNQIWLILSQDGDIYRWGYDWSGFSGNGAKRFNYSSINTSKDPEKVSIGTKISDITYLLTIGYRKIGALSTTGDIYIWGVENSNSYNNCTVRWENKDMNLCSPMKVESSVNFKTIKGGLESFVATDYDDKYYKIYQPINYKPIVKPVQDIIRLYSEYDIEDDKELLSVDFSSKLNGSTLEWNKGIVWVNSKNELKGDYFTSSNKTDPLFTKAIEKIQWKKIKVIQDDNGMCGIDINNQMYCWGKMSFYRSGSGAFNKMGNTFMLPVFNTNLYDLDKDFLLAEGGSPSYLTKMTSGEWNPVGNDFFMKYPTYIGGFNYEFEFK